MEIYSKTCTSVHVCNVTSTVKRTILFPIRHLPIVFYSEKSLTTFVISFSQIFLFTPSNILIKYIIILQLSITRRMLRRRSLKRRVKQRKQTGQQATAGVTGAVAAVEAAGGGGEGEVSVARGDILIHYIVFLVFHILFSKCCV